MTEGIESYEAFFRAAFDNEPFDYQRRLAMSETLCSLVNVPTGAGKTAAILGAWLWRRLHRSHECREATCLLPAHAYPRRTNRTGRQEGH